VKHISDLLFSSPKRGVFYRGFIWRESLDFPRESQKSQTSFCKDLPLVLLQNSQTLNSVVTIVESNLFDVDFSQENGILFFLLKIIKLFFSKERHVI